MSHLFLVIQLNVESYVIHLVYNAQVEIIVARNLMLGHSPLVSAFSQTSFGSCAVLDFYGTAMTMAHCWKCGIKY